MWNENYSWHFDYARLAMDAGFRFNNVKQQSSLDKCKLSLLDVDEVILERDVGTIEKYIPMVAHFKLDPEQTQVLDPNFVKIFRISQLSIEYLEFCKKYLDNTVVLLKKELAKYIGENKGLKSQLNDIKHELNHEKKKVHDLEHTSQSMNVVTYKCDQCSKSFATEEFLLAHVRRRHDTQQNMSALYQEETNKIQMEIKALKERLNSTEKIIHFDTGNEEQNAKIRQMSEEYLKMYELQQKFEALKAYVETELKVLQTQNNFQGNYEKWFQDVFSKTNKIQDETKTEPVAKEKQNSSAQTDEISKDTKEAAVSPCKFMETQTSTKQIEKVEQKVSISEIDIEKVQKQISVETQLQIGKVEDALEEMVANSLKKVENQMSNLMSKVMLLESPVHKSNKKSSEKAHPDVNDNERTVSLQNVAKSTKQKKHATLKKQPILTNESSKIKKPTIKQPTRKEVRTAVTIHQKSESETESDSTYSIPKKTVENKQYQLDIRPSNTSTIGQHSITSLRNIIASESIMKELQTEVEKILQTRLREIGISPSWKGLPKRSFKQAMIIVKHQAALAQKNFPNYISIRKKIIAEMLKKLENKQEKDASEVSESSASSIHMQYDQMPVPAKRTINNNPIPLAKFKEHHDPTPPNPQTQLYETDTETELPEDLPEPSTSFQQIPTTRQKKPENITDEIDAAYSNVVQELKDITKKSESDTEESAIEIIKKIELQRMSLMRAKSALKSQPLPTAPARKKVLFDLETHDKAAVVNEKPQIIPHFTADAAGSTTSITSSVFEGSKTNLLDTKKEEVIKSKKNADSDISDWEISEILD